ncbi:uncharacterized protein LOC144179904 [Haemaphysalis longicornis]
MPRCFVTGCKSGYDSAKSAAEKRHFFKPPSETSRLQEWQHAIPRSDRELTSSCAVCDLHFQEADIVKNFVHNIRGDVVVIPRDKWSLKDDAVPRLFSNCPKYLSKPLRKHKAPAVRSPLQPKRRNVQDDAEEENTAPNTFDYGERDGSVAGSVALNSTQSLFEELSTMAQEGRRLQGWSTELVGSIVVLYKLEVENAVPRVGKAVTLSNDLSLSVSVNGRLVPRTAYTECSPLEVKSLSDLTCLLTYVEKLKPCQGFPAKLYPQISSSSVASKDGETWQRKTCTTLSLDATCTECKTLGRLLLMRTKNCQVRKPRPKSKCIKTLRRKVIRATLKRERLSKELASMKKQLCNVTEAKIESVLHVLPAKQQLAFKTAVMAAKTKMKNGRRYDDEWVMTCLLLQISSPKAYTLISDMQLLPLPTKAHLRQIISGIPCKYGYNEVALSTIKAHFQGKSHIRRSGVLLLDEIKLKQSVAFNKASCKMDGFVDYGDVTSTATDQLADHGLVLMFVPLFEDWVQPIASFATKGAAPGKVLSELVLRAVLELHKSNASVLPIISDGAGNNRSMWTQLGISGKLDSTCHHIEHPCEPSQRIYFICDVPHIIKCIRNHLKKHTYGLAGDHKINFGHYVTLFETEKDKHLRVVPKPTRAHVAPDNLQKGVRLSTQVF